MSTQFDKRMEKLFDVAPADLEIYEDSDIDYLPRDLTPKDSSELSNLLDHDLKIDYEKTRDSIDDLIQKGTLAIDDMLSIARSTEKARDFEVVAGMIKTVVEASKELLDIQKQMRAMTGKTENSGTTNIKNAVFVGSTSELLKAMADIKNNKLD
jgi:uncharacterized protein (DUF2344 family)